MLVLPIKKCEVILTIPATQPEEIKTDHLSVIMTRKPGCHVKLEISVDPEATNAAYLKAVKSVNKEISIPGFRKGKAPDHLIIQRFEKYITKEWYDNLVNIAFLEFLEHSKLYPFNQGSKSIKKAEIKNATRENGAHALIEYECQPTVPAINFSDIQTSP